MRIHPALLILLGLAIPAAVAAAAAAAEDPVLRLDFEDAAERVELVGGARRIEGRAR